MTLQSLVSIGTATSVDIIAYSPNGDPLALVEISRAEAARLVSLPRAREHVFQATLQAGGRVCVEAAARRGRPKVNRPPRSSPPASA